MCGDSTDRATVEALMDGEKADMVFTDPPYNTGMTAETKKGQGGTLWKGNKKGGSAWLSHMFNDSYTDEEWQSFMDGFCSSYDNASKENSFIYVCLDWRRSHELVPHLKSRWKFSNLIIWDKQVHGLGSDYKYTHEFIHVCKKGKPEAAANREGDREYQDVWRIQRKMGRDDDHATKKPIELCERAIRHASKYKNVVLDLFGGSGSTLIACEKNNRNCRMMELDPKYCDVIIKRWEDFTGKKAELINAI
jgi:DNA modification methylase